MTPLDVCLISSSAHKLSEMRALLEGTPLRLVPMPRALDVPETGETFAANAALKALAGAAAFGLPCLADDSGLAVDALGGRPGVHSARYAPTDAARIAKLLGELAGVSAAERGAAFVCALALAWPDGRLLEAEGRVAGRIAEAPEGASGFGYDPIFVEASTGRSFGAMTAAEKHAVSHRGRAVEALVQAFADDSMSATSAESSSRLTS